MAIDTPDETLLELDGAIAALTEVDQDAASIVQLGFLQE